MEHQPGMKLEVLQSWRQQRDPEGIAEPGNLAQISEDSEAETAQKQESLEVTAVADLTSASTPETGSETESGTIETVASSATSQENTPELGSIMTRIAALKDRTEQLLLKVRAHKTWQAASNKNSPAV